jgi:hypothetical protein
MGVSDLRPETVAELWAHARTLTQTAEAEGAPAPARRALVVLAIAGAAGDREGFTAIARDVVRAFVRIGQDPVPVFDAASALADDVLAREILVTLPRQAVSLVRDELTTRLSGD